MVTVDLQYSFFEFFKLLQFLEIVRLLQVLSVVSIITQLDERCDKLPEFVLRLVSADVCAPNNLRVLTSFSKHALTDDSR